MKQMVCAVYDSAMEAYMRPFFCATVGMAIRSFGDEVNRVAEDNPLNKHPADYSLHCLAEFDEGTGEFAREAARPLVKAVEVLKGE